MDRIIKQTFYNSKQWKALRLYHLDREPLCKHCLDKGIINARELEVHHIISIDDDWSLRLDDNNLITLCKQCHSIITAKENKRPDIIYNQKKQFKFEKKTIDE